MTEILIDEPLSDEPLIASGRATPAGEVLAHEYQEVTETISALEKRRAELRAAILQAADAADPKAKMFPAGDVIIRISRTSRRTIPVTEVEKERPDLYEELQASGLVNTTPTVSLTVK